jgi:hypothetical protein
VAKVIVREVLRERLGDDASKALTEYVELSGDEWRGRVLEVCGERVEGRMHLYADRSEVVDGFARIATQMADMKVEILRWSFFFWVGQVTVIAILLGFMTE